MLLILSFALSGAAVSAASVQGVARNEVTEALAPTCGTVSLGGGKFLAELVVGKMPCASARRVLERARFREQSGLPGWSCGRGTPQFGYTSLVYGCEGPRGLTVQAVPASALARIGQACRLFRGPGDTSIHSQDFRAHAVSCQTAKEVVEICRDDGSMCNAGTSAWYCVKPKQRQALGYGVRCRSGARFTSIVWLD
jgi:hypothetical protein